MLISGRPHAIPEIAEKSDAVLWSFYPGPWGGTAIAEVLSGAADPCGCLPVSVPRTTGQLPVYYNARASYDVKVNDVIELTLGARTVKARVVSVNEYAKKDEAAMMYEIIEEK